MRFQIRSAVGQWQKIEGQRFLDFLGIVHQEAYIQKQTLHIACSVVGNDWYQKTASSLSTLALKPVSSSISLRIFSVGE